jgi:viroplasmin and RNaseH domain-containing protein
MQMNLSINKYGHLVREMNKKLDKYKNSSILKSGQDEECERQRQLETLKLTQQEIQYQRYEPRPEIDWINWELETISLRDFMENHVAIKNIMTVAWDIGSIQLSINFAQRACKSQSLERVLGLSCSCLYFPKDEKIILITEREAERFISGETKMQFQEYAHNNSSVILMHTSSLKKSKISAKLCAILKLFICDVDLSKDEKKIFDQLIFRGNSQEIEVILNAIKEWLRIWELMHIWEGSDLEQAGNDALRRQFYIDQSKNQKK